MPGRPWEPTELATFRAVEATCDAVVGLLRDNYPEELSEPALQFAVFTKTEFAAGLGAGVSLFLYRVHVDGTERAPDGRVLVDGQRQFPQLPIQLQFLLTAWAPDASLQQYLTGWMMRVIEDHPVLPAGLLNRRYDEDSPVFWPDETVELSAAALATEDLFQLWDLIGPGTYQLSVPYQARGILMESMRLLDDGRAVQEREQRYRLLGGRR
jgi:Pvc16 N-terminal domain